jgi:hypothetical protein
MKKYLFLVLLPFSVFGQMSFPYREVPSASTVEESKLYFDQRAESVLKYHANLKLVTYNRESGKSFPVRALAKLKLGIEVQEVNAAILSPNTKPYALTGTDFTALSPFCVRRGDYDFSLRGWVSLIYEMWDRPELLYPETKQKILDVLLTEKGNNISTHKTFCGFVKIKETENHILLTEGSRYLTNQLLKRILKQNGEDYSEYDNNKNGMTTFILKDLKKFLLHDFEEYNSRPYQKITLSGIHTIYEYAEDAAVKEMAKMVLDYLTVKFASSSRGLRRVVPFCRQPEHRKDLDILENDALSSAMALFAGDLTFVKQLPEDVILRDPYHVGYATGSYRVDDMVLDLIFNDTQENREFFQLYHHLGYELYSGNEKYVINAGGKYINQFDAGSDKTDGWAVPTSILPTDGGLNKTELIRILGDWRDNKRFNMCVTKDFACGLNLMIPDNIPASCIEKDGRWSFINLTSPKCSLNYGFYVAIYQSPCDGLRCRLGGDNYGFFETQLSRKMSYDHFKQTILANNKKTIFKSNQWTSYINSENEKISFIINSSKKSRYPIKDERFPFMASKLEDWPHAWGDFMSSNGKGVVRLKNKFMNTELVFDVNDLYNPRRSINHLNEL